MYRTIAIILFIFMLAIALGCSNTGNKDVAKGNANMLAKNYDSAIVNYTNALKTDPNNSEAYFQRGRAYYFKGELEKAKADFKRCAELDPNGEQGKKAKQLIDRINAGDKAL